MCTIADIDQDGGYEVMVGSQDGNLYCINADTGMEEWRFPTGNKMQTNPVIVADINNDGEYEAVCWNGNDLAAGTPGYIFAVTFYGTELWRWPYPLVDEEVALSNAIGDVDGDGGLDIAFQYDGGMGVVDIGGGSPVTKWVKNVTEWYEEGLLPAKAVNNDFSSYHLIADIDGDGQQEILWQLPYPIVTDATTGELEAYFWQDYFRSGDRVEDGSWWGDVDGDGISEWICHVQGSSVTVQCLTMGGKFPSDAWYPELYHCAYPVETQIQQDWLKMPAAYSNSLWFPMSEATLASLALFGLAILMRRR
jgi:hypothetical protein